MICKYKQINYHRVGGFVEGIQGRSAYGIALCRFVLMAESEELLMEKLRKWKNGMEAKGLRVNAGKTKVFFFF